MIFAQQQNCLMMHFSDHTPVVKRRDCIRENHTPHD